MLHSGKCVARVWSPAWTLQVRLLPAWWFVSHMLCLWETLASSVEPCLDAAGVPGSCLLEWLLLLLLLLFSFCLFVCLFVVWV